jgi:hypothetical protein
MQIFDINKPHTQVGSMHVINVNDNQYGLGIVGGKHKILFPGFHISTDPLFEFHGFTSQREKVLEHGSLHRIIVEEGTRGLAWIGNDPILLKAGIYYFVEPLFRFVKALAIDMRLAELAPYTVVTVDEGRVGIAYDRGSLAILSPGEHMLDAQKNQKFLDFLPTTQQVRELKTLDILTNDGLMVRLQGSLTFRIKDPHKAVLNIGTSQL